MVDYRGLFGTEINKRRNGVLFLWEIPVFHIVCDKRPAYPALLSRFKMVSDKLQGSDRAEVRIQIRLSISADNIPLPRNMARSNRRFASTASKREFEKIQLHLPIHLRRDSIGDSEN
nr:MAG TPA: hypothetical protein [Caudoviricetes sp.]